MPIRRNSPKEQFDRYIENCIQQKITALIQMLNYVGLECVREARTKRRYTDQSGNLRSSTGYCVLHEGVIVHQSGFEAVKPTATQGPASGRELMNNLVAQNSTGIVLIVVAGMNYAAYVEAKGLNVLDSSEIIAKKLVRKTLKRLGLK